MARPEYRVVTISFFDDVDAEFNISDLQIHDGVLELWYQGGEYSEREHVASYPLTTIHHWVSRPRFP